MTESFLGELRMTSFAIAPAGWALCNGQFLPINQNQALFSLLGTTYGGDGQTNFRLPDLRGRQALHQTGYDLGQWGGAEGVVLTSAQVPTEVIYPGEAVTNRADRGTSLAVGGAYTSTGGSAYMTPVGAGQAHENRPPFLVVNWIIRITGGIFPSQN